MLDTKVLKFERSVALSANDAGSINNMQRGGGIQQQPTRNK